MDQFIHWIVTNSENAQYISFFALLAILIAVEIIYPARKHKMERGKRWPVNFGLTFLNILILAFIPFSFITASNYAIKQDWGLLNFIEIPLAVTIIITLLLRGFISFFTHFVMHKVPVLWRLHRVHHLDTELDVSTTIRFHPVEFITNLLIGVPLVISFGLSPWVLLLYELLDIIITLLSHANISFHPAVERVLRYIVVTPDLHKVHHSSYYRETDSNFSAVFPIWDIIFGTFRTQTRIDTKEMEIGLKEVRDKRTTNIFWLLISPLMSFERSKKNEIPKGQQKVEQ